jgi:hypothetical protein
MSVYEETGAGYLTRTKDLSLAALTQKYLLNLENRRNLRVGEAR